MRYLEIKETKIFRIWLLSVLFLFFYVYMSSELLFGSNSLPTILPTVIVDLIVHTHNFLISNFFVVFAKVLGMDATYKIISATSYTFIYILLSTVLSYCYSFVRNGK